MGFLFYALGVITGLLAALFLVKNKEKIVEFAEPKIPELLGRKVEILPVQDETVDAAEAIFEENKRKKKDTPLTEL